MADWRHKKMSQLVTMAFLLAGLAFVLALYIVGIGMILIAAACGYFVYENHRLREEFE